jgi:hypothetical protein
MNKSVQSLSLLWDRLLALANRKSTRRLPQAALFWILAGTIPIVVILSTHIWLRTAYSGDTFHLQGFLDQYDNGIYRYRVLGRDLLLSIYRILLGVFHDQPLVMSRDPNATFLFYFSYVILDGLCFFCSNFLLLLILSDKDRCLSDLHLTFYFYLTLIQALAMAVVSPYDQLAYLLMLLSFYAVTLSRRWAAYLLLAVAAIAGALTRETQALITPALFSIAIFSSSRHARRYWISGWCNILLFSFIYVALRVCGSGHGVVSGGMTYGGKWAIESAFILALLLYVSTSLAVRVHASLRPTLALLIFCAPYLATILISGVLRELRLLVPILFAQMFVYVQLELHSRKNMQDQPACAAEPNDLLSPGMAYK